MTPTPAPVWIVVWWHVNTKGPWSPPVVYQFENEQRARAFVSSMRSEWTNAIVNDPVQFTPQEPKK